jgi:hypothetical protein
MVWRLEIYKTYSRSSPPPVWGFNTFPSPLCSPKATTVFGPKPTAAAAAIAYLHCPVAPWWSPPRFPPLHITDTPTPPVGPSTRIRLQQLHAWCHCWRARTLVMVSRPVGPEVHVCSPSPSIRPIALLPSLLTDLTQVGTNKVRWRSSTALNIEGLARHIVTPQASVHAIV